jgi:hypothetical protein
MAAFLSVLLLYGLKKSKRGTNRPSKEDPKGDDTG